LQEKELRWFALWIAFASRAAQ